MVPRAQPDRRSVAGDLVRHTTAFGRALRARGFLVGPGEVGDALRALALVSIGSRDEVHDALAAVFVKSHDEREPFEALFGLFWERVAPIERDGDSDATRIHGDDGAGARDVQRWTSEDDGDADRHVAYSAAEVLTRKDFSTLSAAELDEVSRLVRRLARVIATRMSRRRRAASRGRLDLRRTMRASLRRGGELLDLRRSRRRIERPRVVLLCDVSGSMDLYSAFLVQFLYALQTALGRVETFVFSTSLHRVTDALDRGTFAEALDRVARRVPNWSGGTRIGASLDEFLRRFGDLVTRRTTVIVISDGWDTGEIDLLEGRMADLRPRAGRVIWLNPLLGSPGYQPLAQGMAAALPYVDVFAPAHNLDALRRLERVLA